MSLWLTRLDGLPQLETNGRIHHRLVAGESDGCPPEMMHVIPNHRNFVGRNGTMVAHPRKDWVSRGPLDILDFMEGETKQEENGGLYK